MDAHEKAIPFACLLGVYALSMTKHRPLPLSLASHVGLLLSAALMSALALWQWLELVKVRQGGSAACALNETLNCEKVWDTAFAAWVQSTLGMPVAALGLLWGLGALAWAVALCFKKKPAWLGLSIWGLKLWALAGTLSCVIFAYVSWQAGSVCISCMATFILVLAYAFCAFALLPLHALLPKNSFVLGSLLSLALLLLLGVLLQPFGAKTKGTGPLHLERSFNNLAASPITLEHFWAGLKPEERNKIKRERQAFLAAPSRPLTAPTPGRFPQQAPVLLQDFTDIKCGHCRTAEAMLTQLLRTLPEGSMAVEPRYYPLDKECHPSSPPLAPGALPVGVRCAAALAQICLEGAADFAQLRAELFHAAERLATREDVLAMASKGKTPRSQLLACMASADARARLHADMALAETYGISGTPFFLLNGKPVGFVPSFWMAMALAKGNAEDAAFASLAGSP